MEPNQDPSKEAVQKGRRAAGWLFGVAVGAQVAMLLYSRTQSDQLGRAILFLMEGIGTLVVGLVAALIITLRLPPEARKTFWATGSLYIGLTAVIWGVSCGLAQK